MRRVMFRAASGCLFVFGFPAFADSVEHAPSVPCKAEALEVLSGQRDMEVVRLRDFYIEVSVKKKSYQIGETIHLPVRVSRPADSDPLALGVPTDPGTLGPAEDVYVGVGLLAGDVFLPGFAVTDADGVALAKIKVEPPAKVGSVDAAFYAWKTIVDRPCLRVEENGFKAVSRMFKITG